MQNRICVLCQKSLVRSDSVNLTRADGEKVAMCRTCFNKPLPEIFFAIDGNTQAKIPWSKPTNG